MHAHGRGAALSEAAERPGTSAASRAPRNVLAACGAGGAQSLFKRWGLGTGNRLPTNARRWHSGQHTF